MVSNKPNPVNYGFILYAQWDFLWVKFHKYQMFLLFGNCDWDFIVVQLFDRESGTIRHLTEKGEVNECRNQFKIQNLEFRIPRKELPQWRI